MTEDLKQSKPAEPAQPEKFNFNLSSMSFNFGSTSTPVSQQPVFAARPAAEVTFVRTLVLRCSCYTTTCWLTNLLWKKRNRSICCRRSNRKLSSRYLLWRRLRNRPRRTTLKNWKQPPKTWSHRLKPVHSSLTHMALLFVSEMHRLGQNWPNNFVIWASWPRKVKPCWCELSAACIARQRSAWRTCFLLQLLSIVLLPQILYTAYFSDEMPGGVARIFQAFKAGAHNLRPWIIIYAALHM